MWKVPEKVELEIVGGWSTAFMDVSSEGLWSHTQSSKCILLWASPETRLSTLTVICRTMYPEQYNNSPTKKKSLHDGPVHKSTTPESHWQTETIRLMSKSLSASLFPFSHQDRDTW